VSSLWTLRDGQHNSFPYVQLKAPLISIAKTEHASFQAKWKHLSLADRRRKLRQLAKHHPISAEQWGTWPGSGLRASLKYRREVISEHGSDQLNEIVVVIDRFLRAAADAVGFFSKLSLLLLEAADAGDADFIEAVRIAFCGDKAREGTSQGSALYFDVARDEFSADVASSKWADLLGELPEGDPAAIGVCALTGKTTRLQADNFPQPKLPTIGQAFLFAKNRDIRAAYRYGRFAQDGIHVSTDLIRRLAGALELITAEHRKGRTWRSIPSEKPKQNDLLLAFIDEAPDLPLADAIAGTEDEDEAVDGRVTFLTRTERIIDAIKAKVAADFRKTHVTLCVLRKVDVGNAKVILHRALTVGELYAAARAWTEAENNVPGWLELPVKGKRRRPRHIAPLQFPGATRAIFIRGGRELARHEPVGVTPQDALSLFLNESDAERVARAALSLILDRQGALLSGAAHALRRDSGLEKLKHTRKFDCSSALRTVTLLGLLLAKFDRRENYMNDVPFKLGQLLAVADTVHAGYCMDVRHGDVPPTLLGNSVLATAQSDPTKALAVLSRRWAPYAAWAKRPRVRELGEKLKNSDNKKDQSRGWSILGALSRARRADELCRELHGRLSQKVDDKFRAELLLGYVAGLPLLKQDGKADEGGHEE
jgi:hypothetical protein